jgi:hypothetical protein
MPRTPPYLATARSGGDRRIGSGGGGLLQLAAAGSAASARLPAAVGTDVVTQVTPSRDKRPNGLGAYGLVRARLRATIWAQGAREPAGWLIDTVDTDNPPALQTSGHVAVLGRLSSATTKGPVVFRFDDSTATEGAPE